MTFKISKQMCRDLEQHYVNQTQNGVQSYDIQECELKFDEATNKWVIVTNTDENIETNDELNKGEQVNDKTDEPTQRTANPVSKFSSRMKNFLSWFKRNK